MAELKPCPFCGEIPKIEIFTDMFERKKYGIECHGSDCEINPMTAWYADENDAIEAWNRRAEDDK
jgi:Lar family restriction alleviation protein